MKSKRSNRFLTLLASSALLATSSLHAATLYWDGTDSNGNANGGVGIWDNGTTTNWDTLAFGGADSVWTNGAHTAAFGGTAATVTLGEAITVGGLTFHTSAYTLAAGANGLSFSSGTNNIRFSVVGNNPSATVTGAIGNTAADVNVMTNPGATATTLNFNSANTTGWTGTTTIGSGATLTVDGSTGNRALGFTSGITLNGGAITTGSGVTSANNTVNFFSDAADITINGGGSVTYRPINAGPTFVEDIGDVTIHSGEARFATGSVSSGTATLIIPTLTRATTTTSNVVFSLGNNNPLVDGNSNKIQVTGSGTTSGWLSGATANPIIGAWATTGTTGAVDYGVYSGNMVVSALTAASVESDWSDTALAYTVSNPAKSASTLTGTRNVTALKNASTATALNAVDIATETITVTGHAFVNGDAVTFGGTPPAGLATGTVYYVIGAATDTFQVAATSGGTAINLTGTGSGPNVTGGIKLSSGNNLGTTGILNASAAAFAIGSDGVGAVTLPSATSANLFVNTAVAGIAVNAPIKNNDTGVLTLVKSGSGTLFLSGANTYGGGTVINAGAVTFQTASSWVSGQNVTFGGTGSYAASIGAITGGALTVNLGATASITGTSGMTFSSLSGGGQLIYGGGGSAVLNVGDASGFTGNVVLSHGIGGTNPRPTLRFSDIGDAVGSIIGWGAAGQTDSNQRAQIELNGDAGPLAFDNRQLVNLPRSAGNSNAKSLILGNNNATAANKWVINTDFLNQGDRGGQGLILEGSNAGDNQFEGDIGNSTVSGNPMNVYKSGAGKWILSGDNTFTGRLIAGNGTLSVDTLNESTAAGPLGMNNNIQLGGDERAAVGGTAIELRLGGGNSGTLEYTGAAVTSSRSFFIGDTAATNTGGGTIANNGLGAITFSAASFNSTQTGITATRTLTLAGSNAGANDVQGVIQDNVASTGKVNLAKSGTGRWILSNTNTYTGTTAINGGVLQAADGVGLPTNSLLQIRGGVLQTNGTFSRNRGTAAGEVNWSTSSGGFAAIGGTLNIQLDGGTGSITWANVTTNSFISGANTLIFGSTTADSLVDFQNSINLGVTGTNTRTISVIDNPDSANDRARISGNLTNETAGQGLLKNGDGTLELTGTNTYTGDTTVAAGTLALISGSQSSEIIVETGASLGFTIGSPTITSTAAVDLTNGTVKISGTPTLPSYTLMTADGGFTDPTPALHTPIAGYALVVDGNDLKLNSTGGDVTPPTLTSITDNVSGGPVNIGDTVTYTVTFDEDMDAASVAAADFANNGTAVASVGAVTETITPGVFTVPVTVTSPGTLVLRINALAILEDVAGNDLDTDPAILDDTTITVRNAYQTWALTNAISSAPGADKDGDGVNNAIEFVLGGTVGGNDLSKLPTVSTTATDLIFSFQRQRSSIDGITGLEIEVGTALTAWPTSYTVGTTTANSDAGVVVTENSPAGFDTITLTVSKGADPKKFARLSATVTE